MFNEFQEIGKKIKLARLLSNNRQGLGNIKFTKSEFMEA